MTLERPVVFLLGPTASGKTGVGIELAQRIDCQLISCDSSLVYRGMDIGTAKPTAEEQQRAPHRLLDICEPYEPYSVAQFCADARHEIEQARARGKVPVLIGGTMLYFNALEHGLATMPAADQAVRDAIAARAEASGWTALHQELKRVDPVAAARIHPNDPQRIQRALEVWEVTGRAISDWQQQAAPADAGVGRLLKFGLYPEDRAELHRRIALRFDHMLEQGFLEEVRQLRLDPRNQVNLPAMRSVGYRQAWSYLDGQSGSEAFRDQSLAATRQLAKRQLTWMRGMQALTLHDSIARDQSDLVADIARAIARY